MKPFFMSSPLVAAVDLCLSTYLAKEEQNFADFECKGDMTHSQMFQKLESGGGPIFKVVLEC